MAANPWPPFDHALLLGPDDVHVWQANLNPPGDAEQRFSQYLALDERERAARFRFPIDRRRYVIGRGLLRTILADYLSISAADVPLDATPLGKPYVKEQPLDCAFSVAHSADLVLYAIARDREVGIDVEFHRPDIEWRELSERFFSPPEVAALTAVSPSIQRQAFFQCWTRKEAYVKALGLGMQVPLEGFAVTVTGPAQLIHTSHDPSQLARWSLLDLEADDGFAAALAVEGTRYQLSCCRWAGNP